MASTVSSVRTGPNDAAAAPGVSQEASPEQVHRWLAAGEAVIVDVREPDEHARERIAGSHLHPLSSFDAARAVERAMSGQRVVFHCKSGRRSADARRLAAACAREGTPVLHMTGGIEAWKGAGLPVESVRAGAGAGISVMRQVQIVVGAGVLGGCALAWFVHPWFIALPAFFGAGLLFAGASGTCAMALLLSKAPWNRVSLRAARSQPPAR